VSTNFTTWAKKAKAMGFLLRAANVKTFTEIYNQLAHCKEFSKTLDFAKSIMLP
jgi:hypothetical protein